MDEKWRKLREYQSTASHSEDLKRSFCVLGEYEMRAGSSLAEVEEKLKQVIPQYQLSTMNYLMQRAAVQSPHELSVYLTNLPATSPIRRSGIEILIPHLSDDQVARDLWKSELAKTQNSP